MVHAVSYEVELIDDLGFVLFVSRAVSNGFVRVTSEPTTPYLLSEDMVRLWLGINNVGSSGFKHAFTRLFKETH